MSGYIGTQPVPQATQTRDSFTCTAGQTSFATGGYTPTYLDVYLNGIFLANGADYTASNGSDVILTAGAAAGDILEVVAYTSFEVVTDTVTNAGTALNLDRTGSDGTILDLLKDGSTVGSIGTFAGDFIVGSTSGSDAAFRMDGTNNAIYASNTSGNARDNAINLGASTVRWKDLYLSGGVYLGGTGSANKLEDYETGTWTPVVQGSTGTPSGQVYSNQHGTYTKIGRSVHVQAYVTVTNMGSGVGGTYGILKGLPFNLTSGSPYYSSASFPYVGGLGQNVNSLHGYGQPGGDFAYVIYQSGSSTSSSYLSPAGWGSTPYFMFGMTYFTSE